MVVLNSPFRIQTPLVVKAVLLDRHHGMVLLHALPAVRALSLTETINVNFVLVPLLPVLHRVQSLINMGMRVDFRQTRVLFSNRCLGFPAILDLWLLDHHVFLSLQVIFFLCFF